MAGIKLGFSLADYAKFHNMGIGSAKLNDGSSLEILQDVNKNIIELYRVKAGKLLSAQEYGGPNAVSYAAKRISGLEHLEAEKGGIEKAWTQSLNYLA